MICRLHGTGLFNQRTESRHKKGNLPEAPGPQPRGTGSLTTRPKRGAKKRELSEAPGPQPRGTGPLTTRPKRGAKKREFTGSSRHSAAWHRFLQAPDRIAETKRLRRINRRSTFFIGAEGGIANPAPPAGPGERESGAGAAEVECRGHSRPPPPRGPQREP